MLCGRAAVPWSGGRGTIGQWWMGNVFHAHRGAVAGGGDARTVFCLVPNEKLTGCGSRFLYPNISHLFLQWLNCCVTWGKPFNFSEPELLYLSSENNNTSTVSLV